MPKFFIFPVADESASMDQQVYGRMVAFLVERYRDTGLSPSLAQKAVRDSFGETPRGRSVKQMRDEVKALVNSLKTRGGES